MNIGFTGTQKGMTEAQKEKLKELLWEASRRQEGITTFHHGDCIGADEQAHRLVKQCLPLLPVIIHPPSDYKKRAYCNADGSACCCPMSYLQRNREIVKSVEMLFATPKTIKEERRSGTWSTIRYARSYGIPVWIIAPNGEAFYKTKETNDRKGENG